MELITSHLWFRLGGDPANGKKKKKKGAHHVDPVLRGGAEQPGAGLSTSVLESSSRPRCHLSIPSTQSGHSFACTMQGA